MNNDFFDNNSESLFVTPHKRPAKPLCKFSPSSDIDCLHHGYRTHFEEHPRIEHARPSQLTTQKLKGAFSEDGSLHKSVSQISEKTAQKFALRTIPNEFKDVPKAQDLA
ncbi:uncharacterized protein CTHT_0050090 [Thermochaetoides thermophila DSM 1495]|uniref:Uncharacterized protein n=1 Tax=Chaetomium thermophilum (strain DSM 1495 / CBS 144.50 / IMI 039719) TaxID=759272 RepID=G0SBF5_CHATD|nr:hypothetical protein CTHT_0050090 [Thermochaetoides thermophila DSM 1495]EGS19535.1 hypothetical protein CTHT_0050090 [Thermochaetoides thermophila DSM 1495]